MDQNLKIKFDESRNEIKKFSDKLASLRGSL